MANASIPTTPSNNGTGQRVECLYEMMEFLEVKFWLVAVVGSVIYLFGMVTNVMLLVVLLKRTLRNTYLIYLCALCVADIGILVTFFLVFPVQILYDYFDLEWLYFVWLRYVPYLYTISRILTVASAYLLLVCSAERYMEVMQVGYRKCAYVKLTQRRRYWLIALIFTFSVSFRIVNLWDLQLVERPECSGFAAAELTLTAMARDPTYQRVYQLWLVHIVQVFLPFFALIIVNHLIIVNWRGVVSKTDSGESNTQIVHSSRSARNMMISIVTSYLVTNLLNLVITIWEHIDMPSLRANPEFYSFATDAVSLLTITNASLRLPIYYASNWKIRQELKRCCSPIGFCICKRKAEESGHQMTNMFSSKRLVERTPLMTFQNGLNQVVL